MFSLRQVAVGALLFAVAAVPLAHAGRRDAAAIASAGAKARALAARLQAALDPDQQGRVTMAVGITDSGRVIVASSEKGEYLRSPVRALVEESGAEVAGGVGHAEQKIVAMAGGALLVVAAGRPICEACESAIVGAGARPAGACRSGRTY